MKKIDAKKIREVRDATGAPMVRVKKVLEKYKGDKNKATKVLLKEGFEKASKRKGRTTSQGVIATYAHHSGKVASVVELLCETDFVARNKLFSELAHNLALQVASMNPKDVNELLKQEFINPSGLQASLGKDPNIKVDDLVKKVVVKTGENVRVGRIYRLELGQPGKKLLT